MKKSQEQQSPSVDKTSKPLTVRELRKKQSRAMIHLMAALGHTRVVVRCEHPIHDIQILFWEVMGAASNLGCTYLGGEMPQHVPNASPAELRKLLKLFEKLNAEVLPRAGQFESPVQRDVRWRNLGDAMHALYACLQYENMIVGGKPWEDATMIRQLAEGLQRAEAGEQAAMKYIAEFWGPSSLL